MPDYAPITLRALDDTGKELFNLSVPFFMQISVKQVMEHAFVLYQKPRPLQDPFLYTVEYYGYSEDPQFPGYLGYEIESIGAAENKKMLPSNTQFYWKLSVGGQPSVTGADTTYPGPGTMVLWEYVAIPTSARDLAVRTRVIQSRRAARNANIVP